MRILVGYATAHQSTKGIAEEISERLAMAGLEPDLRPIDAIDSHDGYDAVVLGSAIHNQLWLSQATAFLRSHATELALRPVWLFSVSSLGDTSSFFHPRFAQVMRRMRKDTRELAGFRKAVRPRDHRHFAGGIERSAWGLAGDLFLRACGGSYGDHRDWQDIDSWADEIARQLWATPQLRIRPEVFHREAYP